MSEKHQLWAFLAGHGLWGCTPQALSLPSCETEERATAAPTVYWMGELGRQKQRVLEQHPRCVQQRTHRTWQESPEAAGEKEATIYGGNKHEVGSSDTRETRRPQPLRLTIVTRAHVSL